jgi:hypothetical protein
MDLSHLAQELPSKTLLKEKEKGREDKEKDVSRYWMTLGKRENTGN